MKFAFLPAGLAALMMAGWAGFAAGAPAAAAAPRPFHGKVYQVDTVFDNIDVIMPDRKRTLWSDGATKVRVHRHPAQLIDIAMGDEVRGTYVTGPKGTLVLVTIEDLTGE